MNISTKETYSREQLKDLHQRYKKERLQEFINTNIAEDVISLAIAGETKHFWRMLASRRPPGGKPYDLERVPVDPPFPYEEIVAALKEKFPGTIVTVKEETVDRPTGKTEVKTGIWIDWS